MTSARLLAATIVLGSITASPAIANCGRKRHHACGPATKRLRDAVSIQTIPVVAMTPNAGASYLQNNSQHRHLVAARGSSTDPWMCRPAASSRASSSRPVMETPRCRWASSCFVVRPLAAWRAR